MMVITSGGCNVLEYAAKVGPARYVFLSLLRWDFGGKFDDFLSMGGRRAECVSFFLGCMPSTLTLARTTCSSSSLQDFLLFSSKTSGDSSARASSRTSNLTSTPRSLPTSHHTPTISGSRQLTSRISTRRDVRVSPSTASSSSSDPVAYDLLSNECAPPTPSKSRLPSGRRSSVQISLPHGWSAFSTMTASCGAPSVSHQRRCRCFLRRVCVSIVV